MSTDNKDWNIINDGAYGQVFEKKDGSVIITATWDGKGFKYTSHYPPPKTDTVVEDKGLRTGIMSQMDMYQMGYKDGTKYGNPDNKPYTGKEDIEYQSAKWRSENLSKQSVSSGFKDMCNSIVDISNDQIKKSDTGKDSKVLFTTEDGVDVVMYQNLFVVELPSYNIAQIVKLDAIKHDGSIYFSTEKAAKNYVKCNANILSYNDVWNLSDNKSSDKNYVVIKKDDLTKAVNQKLKTHTP